MRRNDLSGTGAVFKFTLAQYMKSKSTIITMLLLVLASLGSLLIAAYSMDGAEELSISEINLENSSDVMMTAEMIKDVNPAFGALTENPDADVTVSVAFDGGSWAVSARGDAPQSELEALETAAAAAFNAARAGMTAYASRAVTMEEYLSDDDGSDFAASFTVTYVYGVIVLILVMLSSGYIVRSVIEEKASRLVETLILSVSPMALILGKILACLCLVAMQLMLMVLGGGAAILISKYFMSSNALIQMVSSTGAMSALKNLDILSAFALIISILLGFFTFAEIASISSACCDRMEDMNSATMAVMLPALAGYLLGCMAPAFEGAAATVLSFIPFASVFIAPAKYITGGIQAWVLPVSWAIQAGVIVILARFGKRVYSELIIHRGERIKLCGLLRMAGAGGEKI